MTDQPTIFNDGAAYERMMGTWSRLAGDVFLEWLAPPTGLRWLDVGCGNGAFTEMLVDQCAPAAVAGIDPSEPQLAFARARPAARLATFQQAGAMALPFANNSFDAATMALVIFFVPEPAAGVAEMTRVVRPGGLIGAYAWDIPGGGFPLEVMWDEMRAMGVQPRHPPSWRASSIDAMGGLWRAAGLVDVETREIPVRRTFADFDEFWSISLGGGVAPQIAEMSASDAAIYKERVRVRLAPDKTGRVALTARANAVKGRMPG